MSDSGLLNAELGVTDDPFRVNRISDIQVACYRMFSQAKRSLDIFSQELDPRILSERSIEKAVSELARRSRYSTIRILVFDTLGLQSANHRLVSLSQSLSSFIKIKVLANDFQHIPYTFYLVDDCGVIYRPLHAELETQVYFNQPNKVTDLRKQFSDMWEQSRVASELRSLSL